MSELDRALITALDAWLDARPPDRSPEEDAAELRAFLLRVRPGARQAMALRLWREAGGWRERPTVAVWGGRSTAAIDLARGRFGEAATLRSAGSPEDALAAVSGHAIAVLALGEDRPWWGRLLARPHLKIVAALPELSTGGSMAVLVVAERQAGPSGQDETFWVTDDPSAPSAIEDALSARGVAAREVDAAAGLKLFSLAGYFQLNDARLPASPGGLSGVVGWSPLPFDL